MIMKLLNIDRSVGEASGRGSHLKDALSVVARDGAVGVPLDQPVDVCEQLPAVV